MLCVVVVNDLIIFRNNQLPKYNQLIGSSITINSEPTPDSPDIQFASDPLPSSPTSANYITKKLRIKMVNLRCFDNDLLIIYNLGETPSL